MSDRILFEYDIKVRPIPSTVRTEADGVHTVQVKVEGILTATSKHPQIEGLTDEQLRKAVADGEVKLVCIPKGYVKPPGTRGDFIVEVPIERRKED